MTRRIILALALLAGCTSDSSTDGPRGPIGKADLIGSCEGSCGEQSDSGNCFCDDQCAAFGDCCADKADVCQGPSELCGGFAGLTCADAGDYCHFDISQTCGAADQGGVCLPTPDACAEIFMPVCGCDGVTYGNECEAHIAGVSVASEGACNAACGVRGGIECGSDAFCDFPAGSHCGAADEGGTCRPFSEFCTEEIAPVCGCDGTTFSNGCFAHAAGVSIDHAGPCEADQCGGFLALGCADDDQICVDNPDDDCDPDNGGADCGGICIDPLPCGGNSLLECPDGFTCESAGPCPPDLQDCPGRCVHA